MDPYIGFSIVLFPLLRLVCGLMSVDVGITPPSERFRFFEGRSKD